MGGGGGGGRAKYKKKYSHKGKLNEKKKPMNPKKYSCYSLKNIHARKLITEKNSGGSKITIFIKNKKLSKIK